MRTVAIIIAAVVSFLGTVKKRMRLLLGSFSFNSPVLLVNWL